MPKTDLPNARSPLFHFQTIARNAVQDHRAIQDANELAGALAIAHAAKVKTMVEIGTFAGGTAWAFDQLPSVEHIITIDYGPEPEADVRLATLAAKVHTIPLRSSHHDTVGTVEMLLNGNPLDLLFIDGSHDYQSVAHDWVAYSPLVGPGGLVMLHDTQPHHGQPDVQVHRLWSEISDAWPHVELVSDPLKWAGIGIVFK